MVVGGGCYFEFFKKFDIVAPSLGCFSLFKIRSFICMSKAEMRKRAGDGNYDSITGMCQHS